jgi:hypothetical protein
MGKAEADSQSVSGTEKIATRQLVDNLSSYSSDHSELKIIAESIIQNCNFDRLAEFDIFGKRLNKILEESGLETIPNENFLDYPFIDIPLEDFDSVSQCRLAAYVYYTQNIDYRPDQESHIFGIQKKFVDWLVNDVDLKVFGHKSSIKRSSHNNFINKNSIQRQTVYPTVCFPFDNSGIDNTKNTMYLLAEIMIAAKLKGSAEKFDNKGLAGAYNEKPNKILDVAETVDKDLQKIRLKTNRFYVERLVSADNLHMLADDSLKFFQMQIVFCLKNYAQANPYLEN